MPTSTLLNYRIESPPKGSGWVALLVLTALFFLLGHDIEHARRGIGNYNLNEDDLMALSVQGPPGRRIALALLGLSAIYSLIFHGANRRLRINSNLSWLCVGFLAWAFLSPIWAIDFELSLKRLIPLGIFCIAAFAAVRRLSIEDIVQKTFFSTGAFLFIGFVAELCFGTFHPFTPGYRFAGTLDPNSQGVDCALFLLSGAAIVKSWQRWRIAAAICTPLALVFLVLSGSRTGLVAALVALMVFGIAVCSRGVKLAVVCSLSVVLSFSLLYFGSDFIPRARNAIMLGRDEPGSADSFNGRTRIWADVGPYISQRAILGYGYGGFWTSDHIAEVSEEETVGGVSSGHSAYVDYLLTLGSVGFLFYVLLTFSGLVLAFRIYLNSGDTNFAFCGSLLVFGALDGLFDSDITVPGVPLMFLWIVVLVRLAFVMKDHRTVPSAEGERLALARTIDVSNLRAKDGRDFVVINQVRDFPARQPSNSIKRI